MIAAPSSPGTGHWLRGASTAHLVLSTAGKDQVGANFLGCGWSV